MQFTKQKKKICIFFQIILSLFHIVSSLPLLGNNDIFNMISLGDSISTAFNAGGFGNNKKYSWATGFEGDKVKSHLWHLREIFPHKEIQAHNLAIPGSESNKLRKQLKEVKGLKIDYATLMVGSNDICHWKDNYQEKIIDLKNNLNDAIEILLEQSPKIKILMLPIPNLYHLWKVSPKNRCQWRWNLFKLCSPLLHSKRTEEERVAFKNRINKINDYIEDISLNYPDNIRFITELENFKFKEEHISHRDCFHPSIKGQDLLSQITWKNGWFQKDSVVRLNLN